MVLRKITVDNTVRYIPISEQTKERHIQPNTTKINSNPRKQNKNLHKTIKTSLKVFQHIYPQRLMNCYF